MEVGKSETGRVEGGREASGRSESERGAGMEEQGKRKRGGTRNAGIDSRRQPATSLKHTTESTRLRDSETRFTTVTHHSDHRKGERERERNCLTRHIQTNDRTTLYMSSCGFTGNWPFWVQLWWIKRWIRVNWKSLKDCEARESNSCIEFSKRGTCRFDRDLFNPRKTYLVLALLHDFVVVICRKVYYCGGKLYCSHLIPSLRICPSLGTRVFEEIKVLTLIRLTTIVEIRFEKIERSGLIEKNLDESR